LWSKHRYFSSGYFQVNGNGKPDEKYANPIFRINHGECDVTFGMNTKRTFSTPPIQRLAKIYLTQVWN